MTVTWMNESASAGVEGRAAPDGSTVTIEQVVPMAAELGVAEALRDVAATGLPRRLQVDLVSTVKGSVAIVTSIYRLPSGELLVLIENAWQAEHRERGAPRSPRSGRRGRR